MIQNVDSNSTLLQGESTNFSPECRLLQVAPNLLAEIPSERNADSAYKGPRLIKTELFAQVLQDEWKKECYPSGVNEESSSIGRPYTYIDESTSVTYHGHVVYPPGIDSNERLPAIVIFQTGAGPHDLYFRWKADAWARGILNGKENKEHRCIVFIADLFSDDRGWGWDNDKSYYGLVRKDLLETNSGIREKLRQRIHLIVNTVQQLPGVDKDQLSAFCFCLSGHVMVELARMRLPAIKCIAVFHGVYDGIHAASLEVTNGKPLHILVYQGACDPFVKADEIQYVNDQLSMLPLVEWKIYEFPGVIHGFTNPSHVHHPSKEVFNYSPEESNQALQEALDKFVETCFVRDRKSTRLNSSHVD